MSQDRLHTIQVRTLPGMPADAILHALHNTSGVIEAKLIGSADVPPLPPKMPKAGPDFY